jgi:hypothetical protein
MTKSTHPMAQQWWDWQPIMTAPKDETRVMGSDGKNYFVMYWRGKDHLPHQDKPNWYIDGTLIICRPPTHWCPIFPVGH